MTPEFWTEQLDRSLSWPETFRRWRCHPDDQNYDHLTEAVELASALAGMADFETRPAGEQLGIIVCLSYGENLVDHDLAIARLQPLLEQEPTLSTLDDELRARHEVIRQFGRFPARNRPLLRPSTPTEAYFMLGEGPRFC